MKDKRVLLFKKIYMRVISGRLGDFIRFKPYMGDKKYIKKLYRKRFGIYPNLNCPQNFNEKNNWRKLYDRKPMYIDMVDKYRFKGVVSNRLGEGYTFPLIGVWDNAKNIDFESLPQQFVLKANHAGGVIVCRNKDEFDKKKAIRELNELLKHDYSLPSREWVYKNVKRKIIAEAYMGDNLMDFKNYCFNGKVHYTFVWKNVSREDGRKPIAHFCGAYDIKWIKSDIDIDYPSVNKNITKPECYEEMVRIAETLSKDIPFVRVDCYIINNRVYVGEMTFYPWGGFQRFKDEEWNKRLGDFLELPIL